MTALKASIAKPLQLSPDFVAGETWKAGSSTRPHHPLQLSPDFVAGETTTVSVDGTDDSFLQLSPDFVAGETSFPGKTMVFDVDPSIEPRLRRRGNTAEHVALDEAVEAFN